MRNLKRALSLALASVMVLGMTVVGTGASYTDVTSKQNQEAIEVLQAVGIMVGDDNGNFNPDQKVTRNEMAVVMSNLMDYRAATYAGTSPFTDVPSWAEPYVAACWNNGITSGYTKTTYGGSDTVTTSQAALMLMKALGYFQYQSDFDNDWQFAVIKKATQIDLFDDVDSGVREAMTRNDLAQLVLNALEAGTVEADDNTINVSAGGATVQAGKVSYNYITSSKSYATAIDDREATSSTNATKGSIVELGEKLYSGDLKKADNGDNFGRPGSTWTYKSTEIGKYADSADGEWTAKVTNKALYNAAGSDAYDNYKWTVYRNGAELATDTRSDGEITSHAGRAYAFTIDKSTKTSSERVLTSGEGVLTQVFVDSDKKTAVLSLIDTGVAKVTKVTEDNGKYEVTVSFKTKVTKAAEDKQKTLVFSELTPDTKFTTDVKLAKDDVVVYTASAQSGEIESMAKAKTVAGKVTGQKDGDYTTIDGTSYTYNFAYTGDSKSADFDKYIGSGVYNLEDSAKNGNPSVDKDATLYLDAYGYMVAFEGKTSTAEDYLFIKSLDNSFQTDVSAKVVFFDGTQKTVDLDQLTHKVNGETKTEDVVWVDGGKNNNIEAEKIYKYTEGSSYDLEEVDASDVKALTAAKISNKNPSITGDKVGNGSTKIVTDSQTVFVDVKNNKTWTGYKNVSNKTNASVIAVYNSDNVAEIVFIYGDFKGSANDDDFVILKGTGVEAVKDSKNKTVYRFTSAYDVKGEQIKDLYAASKPSGLSKGLYLIKDYTDDDYVQTLSKCLFTIKGSTAAGEDASVYATAAKNGVLTLNKAIDLKADDGVDKDGKPINTSDNRQTFAYDSKTTFIVITQKQSGDVDTLTVSNDIGDIETYDKDSDNKDMTGVYVVTVDDDSDDTPLATCVIVVVPDAQ